MNSQPAKSSLRVSFTVKHSNIRKKQTDWGARLKETSASHSPPILLICSGFIVPPVSQTQWNTVVDLTQKITF